MRTVVKVEQHPMAGPPNDRIRWVARCHTEECAWRSRPQAVKVAAEDEARWHRQQHRGAGS